MILRSEIPAKGYSKKKYFIFHPLWRFTGTIPKIQDFIIEVEINCYGVLVTGPYLFKVRESKLKDSFRRKDHEIFNTFDECEKFYKEEYIKKGITFIEEWTNISKIFLENSIQYNLGNINREKKLLKQNKAKLQKFFGELARIEDERKELNEQWI